MKEHSPQEYAENLRILRRLIREALKVERVPR